MGVLYEPLLCHTPWENRSCCHTLRVTHRDQNCNSVPVLYLVYTHGDQSCRFISLHSHGEKNCRCML